MSPGQRRGTCGHAMALFDTHTKCARCRDKGLGQDACVEKTVPFAISLLRNRNYSYL